MSKRQTNKGFTLIELLLSVSITAVLLLAISIFLSALLQSRIKNQTIAEVQEQGLQVMQLITQTLRNADTINAPTAGASGATVSVNTIIAGDNPTVFDLGSGALRIKKGAGATIALTSSRVTASALTFQNLSRSGTPGTVRAQFTLTHVNPAGRNEYSFTQTFIGSATLRQP